MKEAIQQALEVLRKGGIILYPTDTVWGIGCDATNPEAVAKVYEMKRRADSKSLVLLASDMDMICRYVKEVPEMAIQLVEVNDKPMTIIYPGAERSGRGWNSRYTHPYDGFLSAAYRTFRPSDRFDISKHFR